MKGFRFLLLAMAICLASGVKAQFYDGPDDIYYYVACDDYMKPKENGYAIVLNFDGNKACDLGGFLRWEIEQPLGTRAYGCRVDYIKKICKQVFHIMKIRWKIQSII